MGARKSQVKSFLPRRKKKLNKIDMKIEIVFKNPDAIDNAIDELVEGMEEDEEETIRRKTKKVCEKWFEYGEYVTLIVDLEKETIDVAKLDN